MTNFGNESAWWKESLQLRFSSTTLRRQRRDQPKSSALKMESRMRADFAEWISLAWIDLTAETIKQGYHRTHMRTGNLEVAASELIDELERLYIVDSEIGEIDYLVAYLVWRCVFSL
uniref:AlNc14C61G4464 protein n=1 Tax=Albugo laibachii Nc14 TaxID=890382 RepID=F0WCT8_9STRA|nr:AlNc14C61G4464 [Albugo laibachii Nc14]|eukprot:CCA19007.1 AlNc14C61G4464 [Albugo laibachii Nc14]